MLTRGHYVVGLTTASVIWVLAAIGAKKYKTYRIYRRRL